MRYLHFARHRFGGLTLRNLFVLLLLLAPPLFFWQVMASLQKTEREHRLDSTIKRLQQDLKIAERGSDYQEQLAYGIRQQLLELEEKVNAAFAAGDEALSNNYVSRRKKAMQAFEIEAERLFAHLQRQIPGFSGIAIAHSPSPEQSLTKIEDGQAIRFLLARGAPLGITNLEWEYFFSILRKFLIGNRKLSPKLLEWAYKNLSKRFGLNLHVRFELFVMSSIGEFQTTNIDGRPSLFLWCPIRLSHAIRRNWNVIESSKAIEVYRQTWRSLVGGLIFVLDQQYWQQAKPTAIFPHLIRSMARDGCRLAIIPQMSERLIAHSEYRRNPVLRELANKSEESRLQIENGWVMLEGRLNIGSDDYRLIVARPLPPSSPKQKVLADLGIASAGWWLILGLWAWGEMLCLRRPLRMAIRLQLLLGFSFLLLPVLGMGAIFLEKHLLEKRIRFLAEMRDSIERRLIAFDDGIQLYRSWGCEALTEIFGSTSYMEKFRQLDLANLSDAQKENKNFLQEMQHEAYRWGIYVKNIQVISKSGLRLRYFPGMSKASASRLGDILERLFLKGLRRLIGQTTLVQNQKFQKNGEIGNKLSSVGRDYQADEAQNFLRILLPPEVMTDMFLTPKGIQDFGAGQGRVIAVHFVSGYPKNTNYLMSIFMRPFLFERSHALEWLDPVLEKLPENGSILVTMWESPAFAVIKPFVKFKITNSGSKTEERPFDVKRVFTILDLPLIHHLLQASHLGGTCASILGLDDDDLKLVVAMPGQSYKGRILAAQVHLAPFFQEQRRIAWLVRSLLAAVLLWSFLLAILAARRIESPLLRLVAAANRIMSGDFSTPLIEHRKDEFGHLATAFNFMREGVAQGRRLSSLVSDSVRETVRLGSPDAGRASAVEMVVLFAAPAAFLERLRRNPPREVVANFNHLLEAMAQEVREHGGEVNKFIGERILAIFHCEGPKGQKRAAEAAVATAAAMHRRIKLMPDWQNTALGVGLAKGNVLAGILGAERLRLEFTVIGDTVNLASRLCDQALLQPHGGIILDATLVSDLKLLAAENVLRHLKQLPPLHLKGKQQPVEAYLFDENLNN